MKAIHVVYIDDGEGVGHIFFALFIALSVFSIVMYNFSQFPNFPIFYFSFGVVLTKATECRRNIYITTLNRGLDCINSIQFNLFSQGKDN